MMVDVCLASESFYPVYAGPAIRFTRYLPGFAARGVEVRVFTITPSLVKATMSEVYPHWLQRRYGEMLPVETVHRVPIHRVRVPDHGGARRSLWFSRKLVEFCRQPAHRPEVVQLLSLPFAGVPALLRLRRMGIPTIFTKTMLAPLPSNPVKRALMRRYLTLPLQLVSCVVVSSSVMRDELERLGVRTPVRLISNGVDIQRFRPPANPFEGDRVRESLGISRDDPVLLFVGPVSPRKGVDLLLEAWRHLAARSSRLRMVIVGPRRDLIDQAHVAFRRKVESLLAVSGASERVHFVGLVDNVEDYMRAADAFVFTSRQEGMPNVIPEAMASGLPVVTTPFLGLPSEFGQAGRHYLLADFDPEGLAGTVEVALKNRQSGNELGCSARDWIERHLSVERSLDRYSDLYRELACDGQVGELRGE